MNTTSTPTSTVTASRELLSALVDGELSHDELTLALKSCAEDSSALERWNSYQLIGSVLCAPVGVHDEAPLGASPAFMAKLKLRLAQEPAPLAQPAVPVPRTIAPKPKTVDVSAPAANDSLFRWKMVAGFASLAAVSVLAWNSFSAFTSAPGAQIAQFEQVSPLTQSSSEQLLTVSPQGNIVRDARLQELLAAHRQMGGTSALQVPSGFLRNATFETQSNGSR